MRINFDQPEDEGFEIDERKIPGGWQIDALRMGSDKWPVNGQQIADYTLDAYARASVEAEFALTQILKLRDYLEDKRIRCSIDPLVRAIKSISHFLDQEATQWEAISQALDREEE